MDERNTTALSEVKISLPVDVAGSLSLIAQGLKISRDELILALILDHIYRPSRLFGHRKWLVDRLSATTVDLADPGLDPPRNTGDIIPQGRNEGSPVDGRFTPVYRPDRLVPPRFPATDCTHYKTCLTGYGSDVLVASACPTCTNYKPIDAPDPGEEA